MKLVGEAIGAGEEGKNELKDWKSKGGGDFAEVVSKASPKPARSIGSLGGLNHSDMALNP